MTRVLLLLACAGCNQVFGVAGPDALVPPPCPTAVGHDEDGDEIDDACDSCPGDANAEQADDDGDEIGDLCDPDPLRPREVRTRFYTFAEDDRASHWNLGPGWGFTPDAVSYTELTAKGAMHLLDVPTAPPFQVQARVRLTTVPPTTTGAFSLINTTDDYLECTLQHVAAAPPRDELYAFGYLSDRYDPTLLDGGTLIDGTTVIVRMTVTATTSTCEVSAGNPARSPSIPVLLPVTGAVKLEAGMLAVDVEWLAVYKL